MVCTSYIWRGDEQSVPIHLSFASHDFIKLCHTSAQLSPFQARAPYLLGSSTCGSWCTTLTLLPPLSVPLPTALYLFLRLGTHPHIEFKMQCGFTLWQRSVLFLIFVPYLIIPIMLFATSTATENWPDVFLVLAPVITSRLFLWWWWSSLKLSFYILQFFSPHLWRTTYSWLFWICHMLVSSVILYFLYWRNLKN